MYDNVQQQQQQHHYFLNGEGEEYAKTFYPT
jgi:hypothetical protein